ncbi:MAG: penicillin acylase family protein [Herminiimonas sp.]|nr:penicillin acylase family protein [Herminiimonas sp.]
MKAFFRKLLAALAATSAVLLLLGAAIFFWYRSASAPQIDGRLVLMRPAAVGAAMASGAHAAPARSGGGSTDIVRDANAVAHIYAGSTDEAYFALGFAHAQDRLWQLEMHRRIAAGRMAEILGPNALDTDRFLRTLGVRRNAEAILPNLAPDARAALQAYADGINAYLRVRTGPLPPEFVLTGAPPPEAWEPADSVAWQTMLAWDLGGNWAQELMRMRLSQRLTLEQINQVLPPYPGDAVLATQDYTRWYRSLAGTTAQLAAVAAIAPSQQVEGMGSNNWVVGGNRTASGKPLLANDPHLGMTAPALWYLAHLSAPGMNVIGATIPGVPAIVVGHNEHIAWGFTNTGPDVQDLFIERINPIDPRQYQTADGWAEFSTRTEIIKVKGQADVPLVVRATRHGPVITGALPLVDRAAMDARTHVIAFAWTALRPDDLTLQGGLRIGLATNWSQFLAGARDFSSPQQNMVYADVEGNIGFVAPGRIPVRSAANDLHGLAPAPGWDARYDWQGFVPFEELPQRYNPASQRIVTANQKIIENGSGPFLTSEWSLPYRADRITELLDAGGKHTLQSFAAIQYDHVSRAALELLPLVRGTRPASPRAADALRRLTSWNGSMAVDRPEPLIFNAWMRELSRRMLSAPLGPDLMRDYWDQRTTQPLLVNVLRNVGGQGRWCMVAADGAAAPANDCAALLSTTLETTLALLERAYGSDLGGWRWGAAHIVRMEHRPFDRVPLLAPWFDILEPAPGDTYTINVGRYSLRDEQAPFASRHGPGLRALYDLSNLENSRFIQSTGQSGNRFSGHYADFTQRWTHGASIPMQTRRAEVERNKLGTLTLVHPD